MCRSVGLQTLIVHSFEHSENGEWEKQLERAGVSASACPVKTEVAKATRNDRLGREKESDQNM